MSIVTLSPEPVTAERKQQRSASPFDRARMEQALASGPAVRIPHGLSREEMRQFILNANK